MAELPAQRVVVNHTENKVTQQYTRNPADLRFEYNRQIQSKGDFFDYRDVQQIANP